MLRLLIATGLALMAVGFGAAGWQYWQDMPAAPTAEDAQGVARPADPQVWLILPTGGIVPDQDSRAYLVQDRLVPDRIARLTVTARLDDLLVEGEKLPATPYLQVLADIRAPRVGQTLCPILTAGLALTCTVHSARVLPGSVNPVRGEARFAVKLAYRQNVTGVALPDLAAHVLRTEVVQPDPVVQPPPASAESALTELVATAVAACAAEDRAAPSCRVLGLEVDWSPGAPRKGEARIGWLAPLPDGMSSLPPIQPLPEG